MKDTSLWCKALEIDTLQTFGLRPCLFFMSIAHLHKIPKGNTTRQWAELIFTTHMWSKGRCKASLQICPANLWFGYTSLAMLTERLCKAQRDNYYWVSTSYEHSSSLKYKQPGVHSPNRRLASLTMSVFYWCSVDLLLCKVSFTFRWKKWR